MRWFMALPVRRKILFFLSGGMLTLVFDAFIAHFSWSAGRMHWTQAIPVAYGLIAAVALGAAVVLPAAIRRDDLIAKMVGALGLIIGTVGMALHSKALLESLEGESLSLVVVGKAMALAPPLFAPAAFAGVGFLLVTLSRIAPSPVASLQQPAVLRTNGDGQVVMAAGAPLDGPAAAADAGAGKASGPAASSSSTDEAEAQPRRSARGAQ
jgi:hypothetical protein